MKFRYFSLFWAIDLIELILIPFEVIECREKKLRLPDIWLCSDEKIVSSILIGVFTKLQAKSSMKMQKLISLEIQKSKNGRSNFIFLRTLQTYWSELMPFDSSEILQIANVCAFISNSGGKYAWLTEIYLNNGMFWCFVLDQCEFHIVKFRIRKFWKIEEKTHLTLIIEQRIIKHLCVVKNSDSVPFGSLKMMIELCDMNFFLHVCRKIPRRARVLSVHCS